MQCVCKCMPWDLLVILFDGSSVVHLGALEKCIICNACAMIALIFACSGSIEISDDICVSSVIYFQDLALPNRMISKQNPSQAMSQAV